MITLITPTQGNPVALKRTIDSLYGIVDEIIVGSVCIFDDDEKLIEGYSNDYNLRVVKMPINYIYKMGFASTLNYLATNAKNDLCIYLNVGEVIEKGKDEILSKISGEYNCYYIDHSQEKHRWYRIWNRKELQWDGIIHEEIINNHKPFHKPLFTFADIEKDSDSPFKAKAYNEIKELTYFNLYKQLVEYPQRRGVTNEWWANFALENYDSMKDRMLLKGKRYEAYEICDKEMFLEDIYNNPDFEKERFDSNVMVEFQGSKKSL